MELELDEGYWHFFLLHISSNVVRVLQKASIKRIMCKRAHTVTQLN